jgi:rRNA-processing protein FCF1
MNGYAVDTNIITFMLRGNRNLQDKVNREASSGNGVVIPPIAYYAIAFKKQT